MRRVVYLLTGPGYLPYLATSLNSLRRHWFGEVLILAWPESAAMAKQIAATPHISAQCARVPPVQGSNATYVQKVAMMQDLPGTNLFLDADTLVAGDLAPLFHAAAEVGYAATQFGDWTTERGIVRGRLERLRPACQGLGWEAQLDELLATPWPSVNCGVYAARATSPVLRSWYLLTLAARDIFIPDECAQHVMLTLHRTEVSTWPGGRYNASPKLKPATLQDAEVAVWHGHGNMFARPEKCARATEMWLAEYRRASTVAGLHSWAPATSNARLRTLLQAAQAEGRL